VTLSSPPPPLPPLEPLVAVGSSSLLELPEGERPFVTGTLGGERVCAIGLTPARAEDEAAAMTRLAEHPFAPRWARSHGGWLIVPRFDPARLPDTELPDLIVTRHGRMEGTIAELLAEMAPPAGRGGAIDTFRALRRLDLPRGRLDRWLDQPGSIAPARGPDVGGVDPGWLRREEGGRVVCLTMRRARLDGFPVLDLAARIFAGKAGPGDASRAPAESLALDLAMVHVALRELVLSHDEEVKAHARRLVTDLAQVRIASIPPRARREPFRAFEPEHARRKRLFSRWDQGIRYDDEGLYSATPEALALRFAEGLSGRVLDGTCGIGSIAIALARSPEVEEVVAVDLSPERLDMAAHNAGLYGVTRKIRFLEADVRELLARERFDAVVLDPPWGGRDYDHARVGLSDLGLDLRALIDLHAGPLRIKLPKSFAREQLPDFDFEELRDERGVVKMLLATRRPA
jgi:trimethylguanosine synthase